MLASIALIFGFQVLGEALNRFFGVPIPGPVIGMVLMLVAFFLRDRLVDQVRPSAGVLLANLSLLFVPAGVGIMRHGERFLNEGVAIMLTVVLTTVIAMAATAWTIMLVMKLMKLEDD